MTVEAAETRKPVAAAPPPPSSPANKNRRDCRRSPGGGGTWDSPPIVRNNELYRNRHDRSWLGERWHPSVAHPAIPPM